MQVLAFLYLCSIVAELTVVLADWLKSTFSTSTVKSLNCLSLQCCSNMYKGDIGRSFPVSVKLSSVGELVNSNQLFVFYL